EFEEKTADLSEVLREKRDQYDALQASEAALQSQINDTESTIELIREELTQNSRRVDALQNEYNLTKSLVDNLEGFPEAIKFLKKHTDWSKETPLLSDVLTCDENYRVAIENFLEPY